jgi:hypothetical protein
MTHDPFQHWEGGEIFFTFSLKLLGSINYYSQFNTFCVQPRGGCLLKGSVIYGWRQKGESAFEQTRTCQVFPRSDATEGSEDGSYQITQIRQRR